MSYKSIRFFAYIRKSTDREDKQVRSIQDQIAELQVLVSREGIQVVEWLDESKSAKKPNQRPIFEQMIRRLKKGEADGILCWKIDRLSRNPFDSGTIQQLLQDGVIQCIRTPEGNYRPEDNAVLFAFQASMANQYVRDLKTDVERGVRQKAESGWWPFAPPWGYEVNPITKHVEPNGHDFVLLRKAWDLLLTGAYTVPQVGEHLSSWGFRCKRTKTKSTRPLPRTSLYRMFSNPFYAGSFMFRGTMQAGKHKPLVSPEEFRRVQKFLGRAERVHPQKHLFPFTGFVRCGVCGCLITAERKVKRYVTSEPKVYTYYHCTGRKGCKKDSVTESYIQSEILGLLNLCRVDADMVDWALKTLDESRAKADDVDRVVLDARAGIEGQIEKRLAATFAMREDGEISAEEFRERRQLYQSELNQINAVKTSRIEREDRIRSKLLEAPDAYERFKSGNVFKKRQVVGSLALSYVLTLGKLEIALDPVYDKIRMFERSRSGPEQIGQGPSGPDSSAWRAFRDSIRSLIDDPASEVNFE